jgi:hypothetical protein
MHAEQTDFEFRELLIFYINQAVPDEKEIKYECGT